MSSQDSGASKNTGGGGNVNDVEAQRRRSFTAPAVQGDTAQLGGNPFAKLLQSLQLVFFTFLWIFHAVLVRGVAKLSSVSASDGASETLQVENYSVKCTSLLSDEGGFSQVYRCVGSVRGESAAESPTSTSAALASASSVFALKVTPWNSDAHKKAAISEWEALKSLQPHENVIRCFAGTRCDFRGSESVALLLEFVPGRTLHGVLKTALQRRFEDRAAGPKGWILPEADVVEYMRDIFRALTFLHQQRPPVCHRDIKLENVIVRPDGSCVLIDFGSVSRGVVDVNAAKGAGGAGSATGGVAGGSDPPPGTAAPPSRALIQEDVETFITPMYRPPEAVDLYGGQPLGPAVDLWQAGCVLYALIFGSHPFGGGSNLAIANCRFAPANVGLMREVLAATGAGSASLRAALLALVFRLLEPVVELRCTAQEALAAVESLAAAAPAAAAGATASGAAAKAAAGGAAASAAPPAAGAAACGAAASAAPPAPPAPWPGAAWPTSPRRRAATYAEAAAAAVAAAAATSAAPSAGAGSAGGAAAAFALPPAAAARRAAFLEEVCGSPGKRPPVPVTRGAA